MADNCCSRAPGWAPLAPQRRALPGLMQLLPPWCPSNTHCIIPSLLQDPAHVLPSQQPKHTCAGPKLVLLQLVNPCSSKETANQFLQRRCVLPRSWHQLPAPGQKEKPFTTFAKCSVSPPAKQSTAQQGQSKRICPALLDPEH